jgi:hypothetical protein
MAELVGMILELEWFMGLLPYCQFCRCTAPLLNSVVSVTRSTTI